MTYMDPKASVLSTTLQRPISDMVSPVSEFEGCLGVPATLGLYDVQWYMNPYLDSKAFTVTAWNSLQKSIRDIKSAYASQRYLKTHPFHFANKYICT